MTEMDLKLYEFTARVNKIADKFDKLGIESEDKKVSNFYHAKAVAYREVVTLIEEEFRDGGVKHND